VGSPVPTNQPITLAKGENVAPVFTITPTPLSGIAGRTYGFQVKASADAGLADAAIVDVAASILDPVAATVQVTLASAITSLLPVGAYHYWLWRTDTGSEQLAAGGAFVVTAGGRF
jgi:hypothetical protein